MERLLSPIITFLDAQELLWGLLKIPWHFSLGTYAEFHVPRKLLNPLTSKFCFEVINFSPGVLVFRNQHSVFHL